MPSSNFYPDSGLPRVSSGFSVDATNGIDVNGIDRRDHRYLYARTIIANVPTFTDQDTLGTNYKTGLYTTGFKYTRRWGDSIGNPENDDLWVNANECNISEYDTNNILTKYSTYLDAFSDAYVAFGWLRKFVLCSKNNPKNQIIKSAYDAMIPYIQLAIEDEIRNLPNPLGFSNITRGTGQVKGANTCYFDPESPIGCSESNTANIQDFCQTPSANCRDAINGYWDSYTNGTPASISVADWLTSTGDIVGIYNLYDNPDPNYLYPANKVRTQLVYRTRVGYEYFVTVGQYDDGNTPRYMLMGLGIGKVTGDTDQQAFSRHWNRLNYGGSFLPQTFRPDGCVAGLSHVLRVEGNIKTWVTLVYQASGDTDQNNWFCRKG